MLTAIMHKFFGRLPVRIFLALLLTAVAVCRAAFLYSFEGKMPCLLYIFTGIYCPGCGSGRALRALLHLNVRAAFAYNPLFVIFILPCAYYATGAFVNYIFAKDIVPLPSIPRWLGISIGALFILFFILRNIPVFPFSLLAPHAV